MKYLCLLFLFLPWNANASGGAKSEFCQIPSKDGGLYLKPVSASIVTVPKGTMIMLAEASGYLRVCKLEHHVYPFLEEGGRQAYDLKNGQRVFKESGEPFGLPEPVQVQAEPLQ